jgi:hypothetical protein
MTVAPFIRLDLDVQVELSGAAWPNERAEDTRDCRRCRAEALLLAAGAQDHGDSAARQRLEVGQLGDVRGAW